ncbi:MAG TPA: metallophosphoesterase [Thermoleophilaceae bacterium]|nr:metallophosphoesterase [Thermoleophilaceae bacterium]
MRLGVVSDVHMTMDPATRASWHNPYDFAGLPGRIDAVRDVFRRAGVDAAVVCGDVTHAGDSEAVRAALGRLKAGLDRPVLVVAGNHDMLESDDGLERSMPDGCRMLPPEPFALGAVRLAGVPVARDPETRTPRWTGAGELVGDGRVSVVASHFPVISRARRLRELGLAYPRGLGNREELYRHVCGGGPVVVLSGHIHARESHAEGRVLQLSAGALVEAPYEAAIVDVSVRRWLVRVRRRVQVLGPPPAGPDPVLAPADETWIFTAGCWWRARPWRRR